jgi:hypothetical protein
MLRCQRRRRAFERPIVLAAVLATVAACATAPAGETGAEGGPLTSLPACTQPEGAIEERVEGLDLPREAIVQTVQRGDPLVTVTGYVALTQVQVRRYYADASRLQILTLEDEVFEAEVLFASGPRRVYVRALAVCDRGSQLLAVVAPNPEARGLPMPQGTPPANLPTPVPTGG